MSDIGYAYEKYANARRILARKQGSLTERLYEAFLQAHTIYPRDVPEELKDDIGWIRERLTCVPAKGEEGTLRATLSVMSPREASEIANRIVCVYEALAAIFLRSRP